MIKFRAVGPGTTRPEIGDMRTYEYRGPTAETADSDDPRDFYQLLELPERGAPYDANEVVFMDFGACRTAPPGLFDTNTAKGSTSLRGTVVIGGETIPKREQIERAREVCRACPEITACQKFITAHPESEGVWAGTLPEERGQA